MGELSVLPVFVDLKDKKAVVVGGSEAAAWKAELLAAAGAHVHVFARADELCEEFDRLLGQVAGRGSIMHHDQAWRGDSFDGAALAVADAGSEREAAALQMAAGTAHVPLNVIDRPAFCCFRFGSIINRSPVVVGISTSGAAPALAQALRRRIETLLPRSLTAWADLAGMLRDRINGLLPPGSHRRAFWDSFVDRAFGREPEAWEERAFLAEAKGILSPSKWRSGRVTLVGAGPGDSELLTLKAVRALQAADVILFDELVSTDVLELARREAKRMPVGKRGGRPSCRQEDINDLMVRLAKEGQNVVRLKSGDPMIFGRAGEEIARLRRENIPVDVVPGITSALAMAAALGVSLTHRHYARSVRFVTGHTRHGGLPEDIDWKAVTDPSVTTIFYMGGRTAGGIAKRLIAEGMAPSTPVAIMAAITRPSERRYACDLQGMPAVVESIGHDDPIAIGIGAVFAMQGDADPRRQVSTAAEPAGNRSFKMANSCV